MNSIPLRCFLILSTVWSQRKSYLARNVYAKWTLLKPICDIYAYYEMLSWFTVAAEMQNTYVIDIRRSMCGLNDRLAGKVIF